MKLIPTSDYRIQPGKRVSLSSLDPDDTAGLKNKADAKALLAEMHAELRDLQEVLFAESKKSLLFVLQAMDTAGKDSTIRRVFGPINPQGVKVFGFKAPTDEELAHDFLWRIHAHTPARGMISVFNRSHYEDVLVVKVHQWASPKVIQQRYEHIRAFESLLNDNNTSIVKIHLNINRAEQKERLEDRLARPDKHWKFNKADLKERALWADYMDAYEKAMEKTSTARAPWFVVPANRKWSRDVIIASILIRTLRAMKCEFPEAESGLDQVVIPD